MSYDASKMDPTKEVFNNLKSLVPEKLSGVFHCSGKYSKGSTLDFSQEDYLDSLKANLISAINVTKLSIDLVKPGGSIIILNSLKHPLRLRKKRFHMEFLKGQYLHT